ncbi:MAG: methylated-DNA--[protein]-cysteine S-methyltransferase [Rhodospirillaceae bacterium]|nr:methylated-DNA--[protein]-cysteine S-methyltransferase [Rhodospirillaceae bacterium]
MATASIATPIGLLAVETNGEAVKRVEWIAEDAVGNSTTNSDNLALEACQQLDAYFAGRLHDFDLPLAFPDQAFVASVMAAMLDIGFGETKTYGELATLLGSAARAVGTACGRNPIPIIVPCHRVLGGGGKLTGYSGQGGIITKEFLLRLEANQTDLFADP